jgi:hypothetical protein
MQTKQTPAAVEQLSLSPLGAGDLIDRTVRLYRRHFTTLVRAASPPVVASALGSVLTTVGWREAWLTESGGLLALYVTAITLGVALVFLGNFFFLLVMGGASRNLVLHLLRGEPVSARSIYRNVRARFWGLVLALLIITVFAGTAGAFIFFVWMMVFGIAAAGLGLAGGNSAVSVVLTVVIFVVTALGALFAFFWVVGRAAYVPQVMLVEGRGVMDSVGRSIALARGNVRRLTAMFLFTTFASYSALMLLAVPLGWFGYLRGINPVAMSEADLPLWYSISYKVLAQTSSVLLAPVWMLGLSLLYVDERVRHEGYDIELMAAQRLGDMPELPGGVAAPLAPAVHADLSRRPPPSFTPAPAAPASSAPASFLGLEGGPRP